MTKNAELLAQAIESGKVAFSALQLGEQTSALRDEIEFLSEGAIQSILEKAGILRAEEVEDIGEQMHKMRRRLASYR